MSGQERFRVDPLAVGRGPLAGVLVDVDERHAVGHLEGTVGPARQRAAHEAGPDGHRRLTAAQAERLVVVEAHPDRGEQLGRQPDEPGVAQVVGRAGLAGRVEPEPGRPCAGRRSLVDDAAHHVRHEERRLGARHAARLLRLGGACPSVVDDLGDGPERPHDTAVGEDRVRLRHLERRGFEHAERN